MVYKKIVNETFDLIYLTACFQGLEKSHKTTHTKLAQLSHNFRILQKAFFDYDLQANQDLCELESELATYLPVDELGEKTDFILTHPPLARTVAKLVTSELMGDGHHVGGLTKVMTTAATKVFSLKLRAHMHIVKRQKKE